MQNFRCLRQHKMRENSRHPSKLDKKNEAQNKKPQTGGRQSNVTKQCDCDVNLRNHDAENSASGLKTSKQGGTKGSNHSAP